MRANPVRKILADGGVALGMMQNAIPSGELGKMGAAAGLDLIFVDTEHSYFDSRTTHEIVQTCLQTSISPIVRVPDFQYDLVARTLDSGAEGIMFPRTESPDVLAQAISWAKYPPAGIRGFGLSGAHVGYVDVSMDDIRTQHNTQNLLIAQIESVRGLEAIDEIAAVEGLDSLLLGPADMSISLGVPGDWEAPKLWAAIDRIVEACNAAGIWPGIHCRNAAFANKAMDHGMRIVSAGADSALLWGAVQAVAKDLVAHRG